MRAGALSGTQVPSGHLRVRLFYEGHARGTDRTDPGVVAIEADVGIAGEGHLGSNELGAAASTASGVVALKLDHLARKVDGAGDLDVGGAVDLVDHARLGDPARKKATPE